MELVDSLLNTEKYTEMHIPNTSGGLRVAEGNKDKSEFICWEGQLAPLKTPFGLNGEPKVVTVIYPWNPSWKDREGHWIVPEQYHGI